MWEGVIMGNRGLRNLANYNATFEETYKKTKLNLFLCVIFVSKGWDRRRK